jgi:hypothetical protein
MTLLPDITREAKIVSGKEITNGSSLAPPATNASFEANSFIENSEIKDDYSASKILFRKKPQSLSAATEKFPNLIFNDHNRSTAYQRLARSSDFTNAKNSPLATRLIYNWKPNERLTSKVVQTKVKIYKPSKRIEMTGRPSSPYKLKVDYETTEPHFHNEKRALEMKRLQYLKEHTTWSIYPYAAVEEREHYK